MNTTTPKAFTTRGIPWTKKQVAAEREYRFQERIAILTDGGKEPPTPEQMEIAGAEVRAWENQMLFIPIEPDEAAGQIRLL